MIRIYCLLYIDMDAESVLRRNVLSPNNINTLAAMILRAINRTNMYPDEIAYFKSTVGEFRYDRFINHRVEEVNNILVGKIVAWIRQDKYATVRTDDIDAEIYKQLKSDGQDSTPSAGSSGFGMPGGAGGAVRPVPVVAPPGKLEQYYLRRMLTAREEIIGHANIIVDTRNRRQASYETLGTPLTEFRFSLNTNGNTSPGGVTTTANIRDIIRMRVSSMSIPFVPSILNTPSIGLSINQLLTAAYISPTGSRMHFVFVRTMVDRNRVTLVPDLFGMFQFDKPVTGLDDFSISFYSPFEPIVFDPDRDTITAAGIFTGTLTTIITNFQHNLATGDTVIFSNFATTNPANDGTLIARFNNPVGLQVSVLSSTSFAVPIDTSNPSIIIPPSIMLDCFYVSKRISFYIEVEYIRPFDTKI